MSDTPRTDAASRMAFSGEYMVPIQDAQKLERDLTQSKEANAGLMRACDHLECELADMTKQVDPYEREAAKAAINVLKHQLADMTKQRNHYKAACDQYSEDEMLCKLAEVTKQRDALAEALREIASGAYSWKTCVDVIAPKALAAKKGGSDEKYIKE